MTIRAHSAEPSTRWEMIRLLRTVGPMGASALAECLGITHVAIRRHLTALERDGLVTSTLERQPMGRPTRLYSLTEQAEDLFPKKYGALSLEILDFLAEQENGLDLINGFFSRRRQDLIQRFGPHVDGPAEIGERVARLAEVQAASGYLASWKSGDRPGTFYLLEHNCPVHTVSRKYEHACRHEMEFFKEVLGTQDVVREECIAKGGSCCRYRVAAPAGLKAESVAK